MEGRTADFAIIGGGIVGLAVALRLAERRPGAEITVLEKEAAVAPHQTGHNSGVIHAGLYYRPGSLKARLCRDGVERLVRFCRENEVPFEICGKVVVATSPEEIPRLEELHRRGGANGVPGLELIGPERLRDVEPHAAGVRALLCPSTGIVDFGAVARAMAERIRRLGGEIRLGCRLESVASERGRLVLTTSTGPVFTRELINCAGLHSDRVARRAGAATDARIIPFRGEYHTLVPEARHLCRHLIYPVPDPRFPFLGVHFTRRIDGAVEAGPNAVLALAREGYRRRDVAPADVRDALLWPPFWRLAGAYWRTGAGEVARSLSRTLFARALQRLVPEIRARHLERGGAGVRAQALSPEGTLLDDFVVTRGDRVVNVVNAPSPAATASLAIAGRIVDLALDENGGADR